MQNEGVDAGLGGRAQCMWRLFLIHWEGADSDPYDHCDPYRHPDGDRYSNRDSYAGTSSLRRRVVRGRAWLSAARYRAV